MAATYVGGYDPKTVDETYDPHILNTLDPFWFTRAECISTSCLQLRPDIDGKDEAYMSPPNLFGITYIRPLVKNNYGSIGSETDSNYCIMGMLSSVFKGEIDG